MRAAPRQDVRRYATPGNWRGWEGLEKWASQGWEWRVQAGSGGAGVDLNGWARPNPAPPTRIICR